MESVTELERMFWAHHERVLRAAYRVTGNLADAEDVAQAVFLRLAGGQQPIEHAESYLYRAAVNGALDLLRRRKLAAELPLDDVAELGSGRAGSPERAAAGAEVRRWLRDAIARLSRREAEIFVLRYVEEHDNREIARMVGISRTAVAVILYQARAKLKESYRSFQRGKQ